MQFNHLKKFIHYATLFSLTLGTSFSAIASPFGFPDYSDAPAPYSDASSSTGDYQRLGDVYGVDDGVSWSVDGGSTFGHSSVTIGQTVTFKFELQSHNIGGHIFDPVRAWFDANGDATWSSGELIFSGQYNKATNDPYWEKGTPDNPMAGAPYNDRTWLNGDTNDWIKAAFYTNIVFSDGFHLGDSWLRVRATCDASIGGTDWYGFNDGYWGWHANAGDITTMGPNGYLHQGETEDYKITVLARPPVKVVEPSEWMLLALGLLGLVGMRAKKSR